MDILEFWQTPKYYKEPSRACTVNNLTKCFTKISERLMPIIAKKKPLMALYLPLMALYLPLMALYLPLMALYLPLM